MTDKKLNDTIRYLDPWHEEGDWYKPKEQIMALKKAGVPLETFQRELSLHISKYTADDIRDILIWFFTEVENMQCYDQYRFTKKVIEKIEVTHGDIHSIRRYFKEGRYKKWRKSTIQRINGPDTYEGVARIYGDRNFSRPLVESYVEWAIKSPGGR